jgi:hypothetical protein
MGVVVGSRASVEIGVDPGANVNPAAVSRAAVLAMANPAKDSLAAGSSPAAMASSNPAAAAPTGAARRWGVRIVLRFLPHRSSLRASSRMGLMRMDPRRTLWARRARVANRVDSVRAAVGVVDVAAAVPRVEAPMLRVGLRVGVRAAAMVGGRVGFARRRAEADLTRSSVHVCGRRGGWPIDRNERPTGTGGFTLGFHGRSHGGNQCDARERGPARRDHVACAR